VSWLAAVFIRRAAGTGASDKIDIGHATIDVV